MTRTAKYKALYLPILVSGSIIVFAIGMAWGDRTNILPPFALVLLAIGMFMPRHLLRFLWRDLLAGMRLMKRKDYAASKLRSERFIAKVRKAPWLKHMSWLVTGSYSGDPEALALSNLGAAEIKLGAFEAAQSHLEEAIALDPENPLPLGNMGVLRLQVGTWAEASPWFEKARALGWVGRTVGSAQPLAQPDLPPATGNYRVELLNDDVTSMEFVVELLEQVFDHNGGQAFRTMLAVHQNGSAVCGRYEEAEAQARMDEAVARALTAKFPLALRVAIDAAV